MGSDDPTQPATLESIAARIARSLTSLADETMMLSAETSTLLRRQEQERGRIQQFIGHFAVGSLLADLAGKQVDAEVVTTQVNYRVVQREVEALDSSISRGHLLHGRLVASHRVMRELRAAFEAAQLDMAVDGTGDIQLQQATMAAREDERSRLAREIHDGPAQVLANAIFAVEIAEQVARRDPTRVPDELSQLRALLKDGVAEMRRFMADLRPAMLADRGLVPTLQQYVTDYNRFFGKRITFTTTDLPETLTSEQQMALFRIVQEGLQNIHKHAGTDDGHIDISPDGEMLALTIVDQGQGFDPSVSPLGSDHGAGLTGVRERARLIGADLDILSAPGSGTTIRLRLPLPPLRSPSPSPSPRTQRPAPEPSTNGSIE